MPELPEVETTCQGIKSALLGKKIKRIIIRQEKLRWLVPKQLSIFHDELIKNIERRAKYILIYLENGTILIHLGMSGRLGITKAGTARKHDHVDFVLNDSTILRYTDPRRFGSIHYSTADINQHFLIKNLGVEPLSKSFNEKYLFAIAHKRKILIKQLIMDQKVVVGVGNIYAQEALFAAHISPLRIANTLTLLDCKKLTAAIKHILKLAIKKGGTTLKDFLSPDGARGYFVQKLFVYGRNGKKCLNCHTLLQTLKISQRTTNYCPHCQK